MELCRTLLLPLCSAFVTEDLERETIRVAGSDAGDLHDADAALQSGAEAGVVVVLHWLIGVADRGLAMADDGAKWYRAFRDCGCKSAAAHLLYVTAEELDQVGDVAADVGERA
jgi:hypothetical protein